MLELSSRWLLEAQICVFIIGAINMGKNTEQLKSDTIIAAILTTIFSMSISQFVIITLCIINCDP